MVALRLVVLVVVTIAAFHLDGVVAPGNTDQARGSAGAVGQPGNSDQAVGPAGRTCIEDANSVEIDDTVTEFTNAVSVAAKKAILARLPASPSEDSRSSRICHRTWRLGWYRYIIQNRLVFCVGWIAYRCDGECKSMEQLNTNGNVNSVSKFCYCCQIAKFGYERVKLWCSNQSTRYRATYTVQECACKGCLVQ